MKFNIYYSNSVDNCTNQMLSCIVPNSFEQNFVVLTPDRRTLLTEKELFKTLGVDALFNVNVTTLTRFANQYLEKNGAAVHKVLKKPSAVAVIKKILLENEHELRAFKKAAKYAGTAGAIFETISMFKSCNVTPQMINVKSASAALNNKITDIKLVYEKYENYLENGYTDSFNRLSLFSKYLKGANFNSTHFLLLGFEDFTPQTYDIIRKLIVSSASVSVATLAVLTPQNNKNIFLNNVFYTLKDLAQNLGIIANEVKCTANYTGEKQEISTQLFGYTKTQSDTLSNNIKLVKFENKNHEVEFVAKDILWKVQNHQKLYQNFTLVVPSLSEYKNLIEQTLSSFGIPYFLDENQNFTTHALVRFYVSVFSAINSGFEVRAVLNLLRLVPTLCVQSILEYENFVLQAGFNGKTLLSFPHNYINKPSDTTLPVYEFLQKLQALASDVNAELTVKNFIEKLHDFSAAISVESFYNHYAARYAESNNVEQYKLTVQVLDKLNVAWNELGELFTDYRTNFEVFSQLAESYLDSVVLSIPPLSVDTVFIADSVNSYFSDTDILYVLGANASALPVTLNDLGIIRDLEIAMLSSVAQLSPTVSYINKRNKLLLYQKLLKFNEQLVVTWLTVNKNNETLMPSDFALDLSAIFKNGNRLVFHGENELQYYGVPRHSEALNHALLFNNPTIYTARNNLIGALKNWFYLNDNPQFLAQTSAIYHALDLQSKNEIISNAQFLNTNIVIDRAKELFFPKNTTSISQFETYFNCPYLHFVQYGLKLKEEITTQLQARDIGNILHSFVSLVLPIIHKRKNIITETEIEGLSNDTFDKVKSHPDFELIVNNPKNFFTMKSLRLECVRIAKSMLFEQQHSQFVPRHLEMRFNESNGGAVVLPVNDEVYLRGIIDRVDFFDDYFRVIDYKSGSANFTNFTEIASGKKLQLLVYMQPIKDKTCAGVFYIMLKNSYGQFNDNAFDDYKLKGLIANVDSVIFAMDDNLQLPSTKSEIVNVSTKKDGAFTKSKMRLSTADIKWLSDYAVRLIATAYEKMVQGNVTPTPLKLDSSTTYDQNSLVGISNFHEVFGNNFRRVDGVPEFDREKLMYQLNLLYDQNDFVIDENFSKIAKCEKGGE